MQIELAKKVEKIFQSVVPEGASVALLDVPYHNNVGDVLIWKGEEQLLQRHGCKVRVRMALRDCNIESKKLEHCDILLLHGGGNFGDLYPAHQELRKRVIQRYPDKPIVMFPQTAYYTNASAVQQDAEVFRSHSNLTLLVRDVPSFELVGSAFSNRVMLCPDAAHALSFIVRPIPSGRGTLQLHRTDIEAVGRNGSRQDWDSIAPEDFLLKQVSRLYFAAHHHGWKLVAGALASGVGKQVQKRAEGAIRHISMFDTVQTDRLHAVISGFILGKRVRWMDNSYGKLSSYIQHWLQAVETISRVEVSGAEITR